MATAVVSAPGKINLTLDILGRREDGYHDLKMVMQSITLADRLHAVLTSYQFTFAFFLLILPLTLLALPALLIFLLQRRSRRQP